MTLRIWLSLAAVLLALPAAPALADRDPQSGAPLPPGEQPTPSPITDRFYIDAAFYYPELSTLLRSDPSQPATVRYGTPLSGEENLGLPARLAQGRVELMVRMRPRHKVRLDYFAADRNGSVLLANTVVFGNQTFVAGEQLQSSLDWRSFSLTYTYSFYRSDRLELGAGLAVYLVWLQAQLQVPLLFQQQSVSAIGPAPAIPLELTWRVSRRFSVAARGAYFKAAINDFRGSLTELHADAQFRWLPNFTTGVGFSSNRTSLTRTSSSSPGVGELTYKGPEAFVRFSF